MGSSQFGEGLTLLGERLERINLKSKSGIAKVAGTLVCLAGAMLLSFYKGLALTNASHKPSAPNEDSGHSIRGKWILGTVALFAAIFSWSSWFLLQTKVSEKYPALYTGTAIVLTEPKNALGKQYKKLFSMNNVDAFVVDEEAIGSGDKPGRGAKILRGDGALDHYLTKNKLKGPGVRL
ncbi:uncharacterized protein A4U43_C04F12720 [Asparagus officinalis]|uniref:Uncharacterized protein n=1 Tax=Asparagus officinalis TaxID=4686 RepID=A0A5P1F4W1_ASPOF|nr:uncharacterized protein A4U43_C04F12720 [Asparagus officinalis]